MDPLDHLVSKPRSKSHVWQYFGLKADEYGQPLNSREAVCRLCRKVVLAKSGNTTNLRSHLQRRHALDFPSASAPTTAAFTDNHGSDLNNEDFFEDAPLLQAVSDPSAYVPDAALPPGDPWLSGGPSRAALSLPSFLCLCDDASSPETKVFTKCQLQQGIMFGPFVGEICRGQMPASIKYSWAIRDDSSFIYVDATNENKSNWMRYVRYTSCEETHNLAVFQFYRHIYYRVSRPISEGVELRVWIGKDYASLLGLGMGDDGRCDVGEKETALNLLQDIQLVTLPKPSSTSCWPDHSQSQSPAPASSEAATVSNSSDPSTTFHIAVRGPHSLERYDYLPGAEKLLDSVSPFFGLEPDSSGKPVDPNAAVCKLCMERVACADIQTHLTHKHDIRPPDSSKDRSGAKAQQRAPHVGYAAAAHSSSVTDAIAHFLIADLLPPALVEGDGFKQMIHALQPSYRQLPMLPHMDHILRNGFIHGKRCLAQLLRGGGNAHESASGDVGQCVSLSADVWLHGGQGSAERYVTLWAHFVDSYFDAHNLCLGTQRLGAPQTCAPAPQALEGQVRSMAEDWRITQPLLVLFGGEWRNCKTENIAKSEQHPNSTTEDGVPEHARRGPTFPPIPCFLGTMQRCVEELMALPLVSEALHHVRDFLSSLLRSKDLDSSFPMGLTGPERAGLKSWAYRRPPWNKLYLLLNVLVKHKMLFYEEGKNTREDAAASDGSDSSVSCTPRSKALPSQSDWRVLEELSQVLKPVDVACRTLAKETFPRLSLVKPILTGLLSRHLTARSDQPTAILKEAKAIIRSHLTRSYDRPEVSRVLSVACALDPQFHGLTFMDEEDQTATFDWMKQEAEKMAKEERRRILSKRSSSPESSGGEDSLRRSKRFKKPVNFKYVMDEDDEDDGSGTEPELGDAAESDSPGGLEFLLGDLMGSAQHGQRSSVVESLDLEASAFRAEKAAPLGLSPCQWWRTKASQFPLLAPAARAYLSAPAVAGKTAQEFLGEGTAWKRSNIPPERLDAMLFLHHNQELAARRSTQRTSRRDKNQ